MNELVCHRIAGSFHWEFNIIEMQIGIPNKPHLIFRPSVNRVLTDTGSSMLRFPLKDYTKTIIEICKYAKKFSVGKPYRQQLKCFKGADWVYLDNCNISKVDSILPNIQFQIESHIYKMKPNSYV